MFFTVILAPSIIFLWGGHAPLKFSCWGGKAPNLDFLNPSLPPSNRSLICKYVYQKARLGGMKFFFENDCITGTSKSQNGSITETQICPQRLFLGIIAAPIFTYFSLLLHSPPPFFSQNGSITDTSKSKNDSWSPLWGPSSIQLSDVYQRSGMGG